MRVSRGFNKKCNEVVPVLPFEDTTTLYPSRRSEYLQKRTHYFGRQSSRCSKIFLKNASKCLLIPRQKPEIELGSTKSKDNLFVHHCRDIKSYVKVNKFVQLTLLETLFLASLPSRNLNYIAINLVLKKLSTLFIAKFTTTTRTI